MLYDGGFFFGGIRTRTCHVGSGRLCCRRGQRFCPVYMQESATSHQLLDNRSSQAVDAMEGMSRKASSKGIEPLLFVLQNSNIETSSYTPAAQHSGLRFRNADRRMQRLASPYVSVLSFPMLTTIVRNRTIEEAHLSRVNPRPTEGVIVGSHIDDGVEIMRGILKYSRLCHA